MGVPERRFMLSYHATMLADRLRVDRYREAIERSVQPGDVVVDLGAGSGVLSFLACQAGAARVYAIEAGEVVEVARELAGENGFGDRIVFLNDLSYRVDLPEQADVLVTETLWNFGLGEGVAGFIADARERFLKPGARIVPAEVRLELAAVEGEHLRASLGDSSADRDGLTFEALRRYRRAGVFTPLLDEEQLLSAPGRFGAIDLAAAEVQDLSGRLELEIGRAGTLDGLGGWFEAQLAEGVELSNRPGVRTSWNHAYFPLTEPVAVERGDRVAVTLRSSANGTHWHWQTRVERDAEVVAADDQSTFWGFPIDRRALAARGDEAKPRLTETGRAVAFVLERLDGSRSVATLVEEVEAAFPGRFRGPGEADQFVREVVERHAERPD